MYSDRVDSVTRATNPSLLPSLPSTLLALLVRRPPPPPPPPPPTRHLPIHRRIKHGLAVRPSSPFVLFLSFSLFSSSFTLVVFRCPSRTLASLTHSPRLARFFCCLSLSAVSPIYVLDVSSIISSSHPISLSFLRVSLLFLRPLCHSISRIRFVLSRLGYSRARSCSSCDGDA